MDARATVMAWDTALREAAWETARSLLADDAVYVASDPPINCANADEIVDLMRSFKGVNPDVELLELELIDGHAIASLRQPAWDWEWFQAIQVDEGRITRLEDFPTYDEAVRSVG
jgi:hypothetical protein